MESRTRSQLVVFLTYNSVGEGQFKKVYRFNDMVVLLYQGHLRKTTSSTNLSEKEEFFRRLWDEMFEDLSRLGYEPKEVHTVVIYCGKLPNLAVDLASKVFRASQLVFVHCGCGDALKPNPAMLKAGYIGTNCGGKESMEKIFQRLKNFDEVVCYMTLQQALRPKGV